MSKLFRHARIMFTISIYTYYLHLEFCQKKTAKKKDEYFFVFVPARRKNFFVYNIVKYIDIGICLLCYSVRVYMISLEKSYIFCK